MFRSARLGLVRSLYASEFQRALVCSCVPVYVWVIGWEANNDDDHKREKMMYLLTNSHLFPYDPS